VLNYERGVLSYRITPILGAVHPVSFGITNYTGYFYVLSPSTLNFEGTVGNFPQFIVVVRFVLLLLLHSLSLCAVISV
jgi:hypothetical protein